MTLLRLKPLSNRPALILDFDIEQRPLSWYGFEQVSREPTAIAAQFIGTDDMHCWVLGEVSPQEMLAGFVELYNQADIVTGHYIRGYDLPGINAALIEHQMPPLRPKLTQDTKLDMIKAQGWSKSQENLSALFKLTKPKQGVNQDEWRSANRLEPEGIEITKQRVTADVIQHTELRAKMLELGLLMPPKVWSSDGSNRGGGVYVG